MQPNLLLIGPASTIDRLLLLLHECRQPVYELPRGRLADLPAHGTLVIRDVIGLDVEQQRLLLDWLTRHWDALQIVTVTTEPLFPLVSRGMLLDELYYRLNVVTLAVSDDQPASCRGGLREAITCGADLQETAS